MELPKKQSQFSSDPRRISLPALPKVEIPRWLRQKYPDYAEAFDAMTKHTEEMYEYIKNMADQIEKLSKKE